MARKKEIIGIVRDHPVSYIVYDETAIEYNNRIARRNKVFLFFGLVILYAVTLFIFWLGVRTALYYGEGWAAFKLVLLGIFWHVIQVIITKIIWDAT